MIECHDYICAMKSNDIINNALASCNQQIEKARFFLNQEEANLNHKVSSKKWSANECFEHINATLDVYLPRMIKGVENCKYSFKEDFKPGFMGKKMWANMLPEDGKLKSTMKTFKYLEPINLKTRNDSPIQKFIEHMNDFKACVESSKNIDLNKVKVTSAVGPILRFKLGDTIMFMINHNERHIWQAENALK